MTVNPFWSSSPKALSLKLECGLQGLSRMEADRRIETGKPNRLHAKESGTGLALVWAQLELAKRPFYRKSRALGIRMARNH